MPTLQAAPAAAKPTTLEIRNATYAVEPINPGFAVVAAVRVTKLVNGESYAVVLRLDGTATCECPDFVCRHEDKGTHCKHIKATLAAGLLLAPVSGGSPAVATPPPAAVAPITRKDLARAAYFGIKLPAGVPMAVEAPVVQALPPAGWGEIEAGDEGDDFGPEGESWDRWPESLDRWLTDDDAADVGKNSCDEARSDLDLGAFAPPRRVDLPELGQADRLWMGETVAMVLIGEALGAIEAGGDASDEVDRLWLDLEEEHKEDFRSFLRMMGSPAGGWSSWLALCIQGSPVPSPGPSEPRPTWRARTEATPAERAEASALLNAGACDYFVIHPRRSPSIHQPRQVEPREIPREELIEAGGVFAARCC